MSIPMRPCLLQTMVSVANCHSLSRVTVAACQPLLLFPTVHVTRPLQSSHEATPFAVGNTLGLQRTSRGGGSCSGVGQSVVHSNRGADCSEMGTDRALSCTPSKSLIVMEEDVLSQRGIIRVGGEPLEEIQPPPMSRTQREDSSCNNCSNSKKKEDNSPP